MPCMGFEPTIRLSERAKAVHALDRSATVTGIVAHKIVKIRFKTNFLTALLEFPFHPASTGCLLIQQMNSHLPSQTDTYRACLSLECFILTRLNDYVLVFIRLYYYVFGVRLSGTVNINTKFGITLISVITTRHKKCSRNVCFSECDGRM
jgi:hypothetical protein